MRAITLQSFKNQTSTESCIPRYRDDICNRQTKHDTMVNITKVMSAMHKWHTLLKMSIPCNSNWIITEFYATLIKFNNTNEITNL